jgi:hypothetical protein
MVGRRWTKGRRQEGVSEMSDEFAEANLVLRALTTYVAWSKEDDRIVIRSPKTGAVHEIRAENDDEQVILDKCWDWFHRPRRLEAHEWSAIRETVDQISRSLVSIVIQTSDNPTLVMKALSAFIERFQDTES